MSDNKPIEEVKKVEEEKKEGAAAGGEKKLVLDEVTGEMVSKTYVSLIYLAEMILIILNPIESWRLDKNWERMLLQRLPRKRKRRRRLLQIHNLLKRRLLKNQLIPPSIPKIENTGYKLRETMEWTHTLTSSILQWELTSLTSSMVQPV